MTPDPNDEGPQHISTALGKSVETVMAEAREYPEVFQVRPEVSDEVRAQQHDHRAQLWRSRIPSRFVDAALSDFAGPDLVEGSAFDAMLTDLDAWAESRSTRNVVILGPVGVGKTHIAIGVARLRHFGGDAVRFCPVVELLDALRPGGEDHAADEVRLAPVLVLDDLGAERPTEWTAERLYALVNRRWLDERPTIVTSNLPAEELRAAVGERLYSRLAHQALAVRLGGDDRRRPPSPPPTADGPARP